MAPTPRALRLPLAAALALALAGCTNPGIRVKHDPVVGTVAETLGKPDTLEPRDRDLLRREGLLDTYRSNPGKAVRELHQRWSGKLDESRRVRLAAISSAGSEQIDVRDMNASLGLRLAAAEFAWPLAIAKQTTAERKTARAIYNHNCGELSKHLFATIKQGTKTTEIPGPLRTCRLQFVTSGKNRFDPAVFDTLTRSDRIELHKIDHIERRRVEGLGADLVGYRQRTDELTTSKARIAPSGWAMPLNATLDFSGAATEPKLVFHDMTLATEVRHGGRAIPLTADVTAPLATMLSNSEAASATFGIKAMFRALDYGEAVGIHQVEPWRDDQIPVVLVHGLMSSPATWLSVFNELQADQVLQARYQFLAFRYQTGLPIGDNAARLRADLAKLQQEYDPGRRNPDFRRMVLIGHSMGGILSNVQIRSSGDKIEKIFFERPLEELDLTPGQRKRIQYIAKFKANPNVKRTVFVAAPHRGSKFASRPIGSLGSRLIRLPIDVVTLGLSKRETFDGATDHGNRILNSGTNSIQNLRPDNPVLSTVLELPVGPGVTCHSIIGNKNLDKPDAKSTDGVVEYWSSHLDGAASEKVVKATHTSITHDPAAIEELKRILYLHAGLKK